MRACAEEGTKVDSEMRGRPCRLLTAEHRPGSEEIKAEAKGHGAPDWDRKGWENLGRNSSDHSRRRYT